MAAASITSRSVRRWPRAQQHLALREIEAGAADVPAGFAVGV